MRRGVGRATQAGARLVRRQSTRMDGKVAGAAAEDAAQGAARAAGAQLPSFSNGPAPPRPETPLTLAEAVYGFGQPAPEGAVWQNRDNERHEDGRYAKFIDEIKSEARIDPKRIYTDAARTFAYGTDASFYRLIPKVVVKVSDEDEVIRVLKIALCRALSGGVACSRASAAASAARRASASLFTKRVALRSAAFDNC